MSRTDEIRARCESATLGPWVLGDGTEYGLYHGEATVVKGGDMVIADRCISDAWSRRDGALANMRFIAHSREDIPFLIEEIGRKDKEISALKAKFDNGEYNPHPYYYFLGHPVLFFWKNEWQKGKIINGYRFRDGIISVALDSGEKVSCGEGRHHEFAKNLEDEDDEMDQH